MSLKLGSTDTTLSAGSTVVKQMLLGASPKFAAPVLDHVPGAAAAYSLRRLSNAYTGPVVKVRRSSDSTTADFTAGEVVDGTLTAWVGAGDGFVDTWYDQSGNDRDATQATATEQPKIVESGSLILSGNVPAVRFATANDLSRFRLQTDAFSPAIPQPFSVFLVFNRTLNDDRQAVFASRTNNVSLGLEGNTGVYLMAAGTSLSYGAKQTGLQVQSGLFSSTASSAYIDGALSVSGDAGGNSLDGVTLGNLGGVPSVVANAYGLIGTISEVIVYPSDVSASRELAEGEMAWHYGLQSKLPYDHAYAPQALGGASQTVPTDADAIDYLERLAAADGAAVERGVAVAVDDFVKGCKADGTWDAIKASCIMCGARTLSGALVPLKTPYGSELVDIDALPTPTITDSGGSTGVWAPSTRTISSSTTGTSDTFPRFAFPVGMTIGKRYKVSLTLNLSVSGCLKYVRIGSATLISGVSAVDSFVVDGIYTCTGTTDFQIDLNATVPGASVTIESLSIREDSFTPTPFNFASGDYDRSGDTPGLKGNGSTKYLNSGRANDADGQNDNHNAVYYTYVNPASAKLEMGAGGSGVGANNIAQASSTLFVRNRSTLNLNVGSSGHVGLGGVSRSSASEISYRIGGSTATTALTSEAASSDNVFVFARNNGSSVAEGETDARLAFYSIGASLDLAALDTRVTALVAAIQGALA